MEDLKQALRDFVATSNSGKYQDEATLLSKFPELSGYDAQALRDFVATSNSGQYASEEELFSKFPEFGQPVKKKEESSVPLWLQKQEQPKPKPGPTLPFLESKPSGISLGSQRVPETAPMFEAPPMRTAEEAQAIVETPEYKETPYFTGTFGQLLRNMESPWNPAAWVADKIDDFGRAVGQGASTGDVIGPTSKIFLNGDKVSDKTIEDFRKASEMAERLGPSDEMVSFSNQYQESGKTTAGFLKALAMNPGAIPEIMVSSYTAMVNAPSLKAAGGVIGTSAAGGAVVGGPAGAGAAALASIPYAMAAMGATLETNASLAESIKDKLEQEGLEWSDENIKAVISDKDFLNDARVKAATRGLAIGAIDALTGRIAGKVGAKLLKSPKGGVAKSAAAAGGIEAVGGSVGEATARGLTGEEMDVAEIGLEGIAELPGTVVSVGAEVLKTPVYKINGEIRPESDVQGIINTATGDDLSKINIEIINDKKGYKQQIQDKVVSSQVKKEVRDVNPELPEETIDEIVSLEMERKKFEGKKTQSAKDKLASINSQIKTLQENAVQKPITEEGVLRPEEPQVGLQEVGEGDAKEQAPTEEVVKEEVDSKSEIERRRQEDLKNAKIEIPRYFTFKELGGGKGKSGKALSSIESDKNEQIQKDFESKLEDGDKLIEPNGDIYFFKNNKVVKPNGQPRGMADIGAFINGVIIDRTDKINAKYDAELAALDQPKETVTPDEEVAAALDRIEIPEDTEAVSPATPVVSPIGDVSIESAFDEDGEIDYDAEEAVKEIARARNLGITRDRELSTVAKDEDGNIIGGAFTSYDNETGEYTFDVVVSEDAEGSGIGSKLLNSVIEIPSDIKEFNPKAKVKVDVVNPQMQAMLEKRGFEVTERTGTDRVTMEKAKPKKKVSSKTPKAKSVPIPVAIPKPTPPTPVVKEQAVATPKVAKTKAVAPVKEEVAPVKEAAPAPTTKAVGPEALRQEYIDKTAEVRLNKDKSRTPKQIEERIAELKAEYNKLKAEMTAPKPKAKVEAKPKAEAKPTPAKVVSKKDQQEMKQLQDEIDYYEGKIEDAIIEIGNTKYNYEESKAEIKKKRDELKGKKMSKEERQEAKDEIEAELDRAKEDYEGYLDEYQDQQKESEKEKKRAEAKLAKLKAKQAEPVSVVEEEAPSYDDIKDLDLTDETNLEKVLRKLDGMDKGLSDFSRGNLSMGMAVPLAKAIVKSLKVLVKAGITLQEAIKRVAAENNLEAKDIVNMIKELDSAQSPMVKLKTQVQNEIQAVKDGVRNANEAVQAIVKYFNFNAERGNLTRRDLGRVINVIAKVKDQKSLNKAADKIFEIIDKAKTDVIEVSESKVLVSQIKLEARAALSAKKDINQKRKDLSNVIKAMETTGRISAAKARAILNKIGKVNLDNPASVDAFLDYVENVFEDAAYEVELAGINAKIARAKKNINKKIGTASKLTPILNRLFSIKPSLIPAEAFDAYKDLIDMFGASDAVLALDEINSVTDQVQLILDQVDDQLSSVPDLAELLFNYNKAVLNEDGSLNYAETIKKMKEDEVIDDKQYELMQKYKSYILPKTMKVPQTKQEIEAEKAELISQVNKASVDISALATDDEKKMASDLVKLAKSNAASRLTNRQLANLLRVFDNINNGYLPNYANTLFVDLEAAKNSSFLSKAIAKAKMPTLAKVASKLRLAKSQRESVFGRIKNLPLFNIDEVFGDFKTKDIFNSVFNALAQSQQRYTLEIEKVSKKLDNAFDKVASSFKNNPNKLVESKMKLAIYRIQREFESNPGDPRVNAAIEYINETVKAINNGDTMYSDEDAKLLEQIAKDYSDANGGIDAKKLYNSFNSAEKEALDVFDEINKSLEKYAVFTGDVIRGDKVYLLNNYNHLNVLPKKNENPDTIGDAIKKFDTKGVVSTKAKSLIERTQGAKAINFDIFSTMQRGANYVLMDYHLTNPVRVARRTISSTRQLMEEQGTLTQEKNNVLNAISDSVELALKAMLDSSMVKDTFADMVVKELAKTGYRAMLAGIPRATTELTSNMAYVAMVGFSEFKTGISLWDKLVSGDAVNIMEAVGSKVISRIYGSDPLGGRLIDTSVLSKKTGIGESSLKGGFRNVINTIHNNSTKKVKNAVELTADTLVSTPDKIMMRPLWFGSFSNAFKDITGVQPDFEKIASRDVDYMIKYQDAMDSAGKVADEKVTMAGNVDNPFMNSLRSYVPSDVSALTKSFKIFNNFMNKFMIGEFLTARRGALAMVGNGNISKTEGAKLMAAVVARMTVYSVMLSMVSQFFYGLFLDDEDEDDEKSFAQKLGQGLASTLTSLLLGRDFGNAMRSVVNYGVEKVNEKYLDFLRDGEYDPYEDAIQYTFIPPEKKGKSLEAFDVLANVSGPYAPSLKSMAFITKKLTETPKKEGDAIERQEQERNIRIPLEVLGNLGYLPLYKDIRSIVNKSIYSELDKEMDKKGESKEEFKPMGLNKSDLKRYYPEIYEQYYGEGTEEDAKRKLEYEKNRLEREMKDEYYQYVPKQRSKAGFGGKGFGTGTGKKSGGFGSKGFGK
jgi:ribosomal protein S18 acetylase RimI-like enzyme